MRRRAGTARVLRARPFQREDPACQSFGLSQRPGAGHVALREARALTDKMVAGKINPALTLRARQHDTEAEQWIGRRLPLATRTQRSLAITSVRIMDDGG